MIASPQNEKLKLVRKLRERKHREREGLFATEGEDLVEAGLAAGVEPRFVLTAAGGDAPGAGTPRRSSRSCWPSVSSLGSGTRAIAVWPRAGQQPTAPCLYLHGVGDPGNVGTIIRTRRRPDRRLGGSRARMRRPLLAQGGAGDDGLDLRPAAGRGRGGGDPRPAGGAGRPRRRGAGRARRRWDASASARSGRGCPTRSSPQCDTEVTIPLRGGAESLNVAAAAAIACQRVADAAPISSPAMPEDAPDA